MENHCHFCLHVCFFSGKCEVFGLSACFFLNWKDTEQCLKKEGVWRRVLSRTQIAVQETVMLVFPKCYV